MIKCVIIDDEPLAIKLLESYVKKAPGIELVKTFDNPIEGLQELKQLDVNLIFLDVQMPELNGIQFLKIMKGKYHFVMTTAYQKYAFDGFEHNVIDYLLKPITFERFMICLDSVTERIQKSIKTEEVPKTENQVNFIFVQSEYKAHKINLNEITYLEGMSDYVSINLGEKRILTLN